MSEVESYITGNTTQAEIIALLDKVCSVVPSVLRTGSAPTCWTSTVPSSFSCWSTASPGHYLPADRHLLTQDG